MRRLLLLFISLAVPWTMAFAQAKDTSQTAHKVPAATQAPPSAFAGEETCALCHAEVAKKFSSNPHSQLALMHGGKGVTCEACHGPGAAHVASGGDPTKILQLSKL
jgi:cytochrome c553